MLKIANYEIRSIMTSPFKLDGGAMFGVVPRPLWEKKAPADDKNRIQMGLNALLLTDGQRVILVDTGVGTKMGDKLNKIYVVDFEAAELTRSLKEAGFDPGDVTDVILTHLHFDHVGGATYEQGDTVVPTFPNAKYYVQKKHWEWAHDPSERDQASFFGENYDPLQENGLLEILDGPCELFPGVELLEVNGHTPGQQLVKVSDERKTLLHCGDLIPLSAHVPVPWVMGYDLFPLTTVAEKKNYLSQAVDENWLLFFEHDPYVVLGNVALTDKGYALNETFNLKTDFE